MRKTHGKRTICDIQERTDGQASQGPGLHPWPFARLGLSHLHHLPITHRPVSPHAFLSSSCPFLGSVQECCSERISSRASMRRDPSTPPQPSQHGKRPPVPAKYTPYGSASAGTRTAAPSMVSQPLGLLPDGERQNHHRGFTPDGFHYPAFFDPPFTISVLLSTISDTYRNRRPSWGALTTVTAHYP